MSGRLALQISVEDDMGVIDRAKPSSVTLFGSATSADD